MPTDNSRFSFAVGVVVVVELNQEIGEVGTVLRADLLNQRLRADAAFLRQQHDGGAVCIVGAHVGAVDSAQALVAHPDVSLQVLNQVAQVDRPVGVGQCTGDQDAATGWHGGSK